MASISASGAGGIGKACTPRLLGSLHDAGRRACASLRREARRRERRLFGSAAQRVALAVLFATILPAGAADRPPFPAKPLRLITELAAGTGGDLFLRRLLPHITAGMGQPVVLDNRPGAGGLVAAELAMRAPADGYTLLAATQNALVMGPFLAKANRLDVSRDFVPITQLWKATTLLVAGPKLPVKTVAELLEFAKANPGKVSYGTSGFGTSHHFTGEEIQQLTGVRLVHVPYKGGTGAMLAAIAGEVDVAIGFGATALSALRSGKLRVLAVVEGKPFGGIPEVPTLANVIAGFETPPSWLGVFGPAALAPARAERLRAGFVQAIQASASTLRSSDEGLELVGNTRAEFGAQLKRQTELIGRIARTVRIQRTAH